MIEHFFTAPAACGGAPFHHYVVPPPPSAGVGKFMEEKGTAPLSLPSLHYTYTIITNVLWGRTFYHECLVGGDFCAKIEIR